MKGEILGEIGIMLVVNFFLLNHSRSCLMNSTKYYFSHFTLLPVNNLVLRIKGKSKVIYPCISSLYDIICRAALTVKISPRVQLRSGHAKHFD